MFANVSLRQLERCVVRRDCSLIAEDMDANRKRVHESVDGRRILVVGGAGTIGSATTQLLLDFGPRAVHVIDHSENYLAELARDIRNRAGGTSGADLRMWPLDYGGAVTQRLLQEQAPYDMVFNFAALKHVRSEKDIYSLLQMIDTNIVRQARFKRWIMDRGGCARYFGVSTDKAANPVSLMGATKRLMEDVLFGVATHDSCAVASARFANVAFSNGSLLQAWLRRLDLSQPLAVPSDTRRYFVTQREAGEICLLAGLLAAADTIVIPRMDRETELRLLEDLAVDVLSAHGLEAVVFRDEAAASAELEGLRASGRWPLLLTPQDTSGEKPYEEFVGKGETVCDAGFKNLLALARERVPAVSMDVIEQMSRLVERAGSTPAKADIVALMAAAIPNFRHIETGKSLDERI
jgi:FlaA1/EpsC-like NDP-sugar epimerase